MYVEEKTVGFSVCIISGSNGGVLCSPEDKWKLLCTMRSCKARTLKTRVVSKPCLINTGLSLASSLVISEFQGAGEITRGLLGPTLVVFGKQNTVRVLAGKFVSSLGKQTKKPK